MAKADVVPALRPYREADVPALAAVFTAAVHALTAGHYDAAQRHAWAPIPPELDEWRNRFAGLHTIVAEDAGACLGFISYETDGHIDLLYVSPRAVRRGVASALLREAVARLAALGEATELFTEASLAAAPFFTRHGFERVDEHTVVRRGVAFRRFAMRRRGLQAGPERGSRA